MKLLLKKIKCIAVFIMAVSFIGCSEDAIILPKITAGFTYTLNEETGTVEFINISENARAYEWDFGNEISSKEKNPINTYGSGTFTVILKAMNAAGAVAYFEDVIVINIPLPLGLPMTFDDSNVVYKATVFDGTAFEVLENPAQGGTNNVASMVGAITNSGAIYEGVFFELGTAINLASEKTLKMNFWSDVTVDVLVKLEEGVLFSESSASHTGAGWEELQFTYTGTASYSKLVIFVAGPGTAVGTFYMDDVMQISLGDAPVILLNGEASISLTQGDTYAEQGATASDTEDGDISSAIAIAGDVVDGNTVGTYEVTYTVTDSEGNTTVATRSVTVSAPGACDTDATQSLSAADLNMTMGGAVSATEDGATFEIIDNPDFDNDENISCKVGKVTKLGNQNWDNIQLDFTSKFDFNANTGLKIKVWSSRANTEVRIKLEEIGNVNNNVESFLTTSVTNGWEELTFPFAGADSDKFNKIVIFFDLNALNSDTYYFDDLQLYGTGSGGGGGTGGGGNSIGGGDGCATTTACPAAPAGELLNNGDFEECDCDWQLISNGGTASISTTINNGGSKSAQIQSATGANPALKQERFAVGSIQPNTTYTVTFDIKASGAFGEGGVFKAFIFSEGVNGGNVNATMHALTEDTTSISTTSWESKSYTFTTPGNANQVEGGISFLAELVNSTAYVNIDNVVVKVQ